MHLAGVDQSVTIAKIVGVDAVDIKSAIAAPLQNGDAIDVPFQQKVHGMTAELHAVEAVEMDRPSAALRVPDLACEDRRAGRLVAALAREITVPETVN